MHPPPSTTAFNMHIQAIVDGGGCTFEPIVSQLTCLVKDRCLYDLIDAILKVSIIFLEGNKSCLIVRQFSEIQNLYPQIVLRLCIFLVGYATVVKKVYLVHLYFWRTTLHTNVSSVILKIRRKTRNITY